jgi:hypothetical protein
MSCRCQAKLFGGRNDIAIHEQICPGEAAPAE